MATTSVPILPYAALQGACMSSLAFLRRLWPDGVPLTEEALRAVTAEGLDLQWAVNHVLRAPARAEYERVRAQARAEYERVHAQAWAEYERVRGPAWAEYERVRAQARAEFERVRAQARAEYERVRAQAWAEFERVHAQALLAALRSQYAATDDTVSLVVAR